MYADSVDSMVLMKLSNGILKLKDGVLSDSLIAIRCPFAQFFLDAEQLVVLGHTVASAQ